LEAEQIKAIKAEIAEILAPTGRSGGSVGKSPCTDFHASETILELPTEVITEGPKNQREAVTRMKSTVPDTSLGWRRRI